MKNLKLFEDKIIREKAINDLTSLLKDSDTPFDKCHPSTREAWIQVWIRGYEQCNAEWIKAIANSTMIV